MCFKQKTFKTFFQKLAETFFYNELTLNNWAMHIALCTFLLNLFIGKGGGVPPPSLFRVWVQRGVLIVLLRKLGLDNYLWNNYLKGVNCSRIFFNILYCRDARKGLRQKLSSEKSLKYNFCWWLLNKLKMSLHIKSLEYPIYNNIPFISPFIWPSINEKKQCIVLSVPRR